MLRMLRSGEERLANKIAEHLQAQSKILEISTRLRKQMMRKLTLTRIWMKVCHVLLCASLSSRMKGGESSAERVSGFGQSV